MKSNDKCSLIFVKSSKSAWLVRNAKAEKTTQSSWLKCTYTWRYTRDVNNVTCFLCLQCIHFFQVYMFPAWDYSQASVIFFPSEIIFIRLRLASVSFHLFTSLYQNRQFDLFAVRINSIWNFILRIALINVFIFVRIKWMCCLDLLHTCQFDLDTFFYASAFYQLERMSEHLSLNEEGVGKNNLVIKQKGAGEKAYNHVRGQVFQLSNAH